MFVQGCPDLSGNRATGYFLKNNTFTGPTKHVRPFMVNVPLIMHTAPELALTSRASDSVDFKVFTGDQL